jgi:hypothetical protein
MTIQYDDICRSWRKAYKYVETQKERMDVAEEVDFGQLLALTRI